MCKKGYVLLVNISTTISRLQIIFCTDFLYLSESCLLLRMTFRMLTVVAYSLVSNRRGATPIYFGTFFQKKKKKKKNQIRRDFLCGAQKVLCYNRHAYTIRHFYSIP